MTKIPHFIVAILTTQQHNKVDERDSFWLREIEKVALNQSKHTKVLNALSIDNTPEKAHELLLKIKYWSEFINPYPERHKIYPNEELTLDFRKVIREDLTHLQSFAIDNSDSSEADDAISLDGERVWIHIADVASQVDIDSELDVMRKSEHQICTCLTKPFTCYLLIYPLYVLLERVKNQVHFRLVLE